MSAEVVSRLQTSGGARSGVRTEYAHKNTATDTKIETKVFNMLFMCDIVGFVCVVRQVTALRSRSVSQWQNCTESEIAHHVTNNYFFTSQRIPLQSTLKEDSSNMLGVAIACPQTILQISESPKSGAAGVFAPTGHQQKSESLQRTRRT
jgi:hypothetical protein